MLRQASIEADPASRTIRLRFEYDGNPADAAKESCSSAAAEIVVDFPAPWELDEQHLIARLQDLYSPSSMLRTVVLRPKMRANDQFE